MSLRFWKSERLCNRKKLSALFKGGKTIHQGSFRLSFLEEDSSTPGVKIVFLIPKKRIPTASDRNKIRRRIKESYRHHKFLLENYCQKTQKSLSLLIGFSGNKVAPFKEINIAIESLIKTFVRESE